MIPKLSRAATNERASWMSNDDPLGVLLYMSTMVETYLQVLQPLRFFGFHARWRGFLSGAVAGVDITIGRDTGAGL